MVKQTDYIDVNQFDEPEYCSLVKATRLIAFNERPIEDSISELVYPNYEGSLAHHFFIGEDKERFDSACKILQVILLQGKLIARGRVYNIDSDLSLIDAEMQDIPKDAWNQVDNSEELFKYNPMHITSICTKSEITYFPKDRPQQGMLFGNIELKTKELKKILSIESHKKRHAPTHNRVNTGRKPKYDWHNHIYPEIALYIHENGNVENASKMAEDIYALCSKKYGEENTPDIETIRKLAATPICRVFIAGNN